MKKYLLLISGLLLIPILNGYAQQAPGTDIFHDSEGNTWHTIHLDVKAKKLLKIWYLNSDDPVEGKLSEDGMTILIKNYPGDRAVKVLIKTETGEEEIQKSKCFIDPFILQSYYLTPFDEKRNQHTFVIDSGDPSSV